MDDLTNYLYEFLMERRMDGLRSIEEYEAYSSAIVLQEEQLKSCLDEEQQDRLDRLIDQILEQESMEREYQFQMTLDLIRELNALVGA